MTEFWYSALTDSGTVQEGYLNAASEAALQDQPRQDGSVLIRTEIREKTTAARKLTDGTIERKEILASDARPFGALTPTIICSQPATGGGGGGPR